MKKNRISSFRKSRPAFKKKRETPVKNDRRSEADDEELADSDSDLSDIPSQLRSEEGAKRSHEVENEDLNENAGEKRLRLARNYLNALNDEAEIEEFGFDAAEIERDYITERLKKDAIEADQRTIKKLADHCSALEGATKVFRGHQLSVTCVAVTDEETYIYSASKDCSIIKWELKTGKKIFTIPGGKKGTEKKFSGHTDHILGLAVSFDDLFLASCGRDKKICIWDSRTGKFLSSFGHHRNLVSGVVFRKNSHQLFSASFDKMIKIWDIDQMGYVDTLFGHEDDITGIDALAKERCITAGGQDRTVRLWKVIEESQLVFRETASGSIDCVKLVNEDIFISGSTDGTISLWSVNRKQPICTVVNAHGPNQWIVSLAALPYTDLIASGSGDGFVRIWQIEEKPLSLKQVFSIPVNGIVNFLTFSGSGNYLIAGVGQEHRMGRWMRQADAKNLVHVIPLKKD